MKLFVLRHGKAGEGFPDEIRELTNRGRDDLDTALSRRSGDIGCPAEIQSSPLIRALQTAEIASNILGFGGSVKINEHLVPWSTPTELLNSLDDRLESVLVASHQPFVSELVECLTGESVAMPTSALAAIEVEYLAEGGGTLLWLESR